MTTTTIINKLAIHLLILLSSNILSNGSHIHYQTDKNQLCRVVDNGTGVEGEDFVKIEAKDCDQCEKECTDDDKCASYECGQGHCELWRCKPEFLQGKTGYDCAKKKSVFYSKCSDYDHKTDSNDYEFVVEENSLCRTDEYPEKDGRGVVGIDYEEFEAKDSAECEAECAKREKCEATESNKESGHCELWYYAPKKFEYKGGFQCKYKKYIPTSQRCADGFRKGYLEARRTYFEHYHKNCAGIFEFDAQIKTLLEEYAGRGKYRGCIRKGLTQFDLDKSKKCLTKSACNEYGFLASGLVINDFCKLPSTLRRTNYVKEECRERAKSVCQVYLAEELYYFLDSGYDCPEIDNDPQNFFDYAPELSEECDKVVKSLTSEPEP